MCVIMYYILLLVSGKVQKSAEKVQVWLQVTTSKWRIADIDSSSILCTLLIGILLFGGQNLTVFCGFKKSKG